jgi:CRISPR/Cas system CMR subunit Cmr4 (Cas7 group RAMP superfamily)
MYNINKGEVIMGIDKAQIIKDFEINSKMNPHLEIDISREIEFLAYCLDFKKTGDPTLLSNALSIKGSSLIEDTIFLNIFGNEKSYEESNKIFQKMLADNKKELLERIEKIKNFNKEEIQFLSKFWPKAIHKMVFAIDNGVNISLFKQKHTELTIRNRIDTKTTAFEMNNYLNDMIKNTGKVK